VICLDVLPEVLAIARQRFPAADVRESELEALPFANASFDAVIAISSIFYAEDMAASVRKLAYFVRFEESP
jgi:ubiquinone/menaquinone biosynthesis C-methylase UbiE